MAGLSNASVVGWIRFYSFVVRPFIDAIVSFTCVVVEFPEEIGFVFLPFGLGLCFRKYILHCPAWIFGKFFIAIIVELEAFSEGVDCGSLVTMWYMHFLSTKASDIGS